MNSTPIIEFARDEMGAVGFSLMDAHNDTRDKNAAILFIHPIRGDIRLGETATEDKFGEALIGFAFYQDKSVDNFIEALENVKKILAKQRHEPEDNPLPSQTERP